MMNFEQMQFSLSNVQWLVMAAIGIYTWMVGRASASNKEIVDLRERVVALEVEMKNMPSEATVRELIEKLAGLAAHSQGTVKQLDALQQTVSRIDDFLRLNR